MICEFEVEHSVSEFMSMFHFMPKEGKRGPEQTGGKCVVAPVADVDSSRLLSVGTTDRYPARFQVTTPGSRPLALLAVTEPSNVAGQSARWARCRGDL